MDPIDVKMLCAIALSNGNVCAIASLTVTDVLATEIGYGWQSVRGRSVKFLFSTSVLQCTESIGGSTTLRCLE